MTILLLPGHPPPPPRGIALQTRGGWDIPNSVESIPGDNAVQLARKNLPTLPLQCTPLSGPTSYNCHGLTFASRRTSIPRPGEDDDQVVRRILRDDGYERVQSIPRVGDVVAYITDGKIVHTGLVCRLDRVHTRATSATPLVFIWSAWGSLGEFEHPATGLESMYGTPEYWRRTP